MIALANLFVNIVYSIFMITLGLVFLRLIVNIGFTVYDKWKGRTTKKK